MLHIRPKRWFSRSFRVLDQEGNTLTEVHQARLRKRGAFAVGGTRYTVLRTSGLRTVFQLEQPEGVLAEATKPSVFRRAFDIVTPRERLRLQASSPFGRAFGLYRDGALVGSIRPTRWLARSAEADLPDDLSLPLRVFLVFLVLVLWRRAAKAAGAA